MRSGSTEVAASAAGGAAGVGGADVVTVQPFDAALGLPDARLEVADLARLRAELGPEDFRRAVTAVLPDESVRGLARLLDDFATAGENRQN